MEGHGGSSCSQCPAGTWSAGSLDPCTPCLPGLVSPPGSDDVDDCVPCQLVSGRIPGLAAATHMQTAVTQSLYARVCPCRTRRCVRRAQCQSMVCARLVRPGQPTWLMDHRHAMCAAQVGGVEADSGAKPGQQCSAVILASKHRLPPRCKHAHNI